MSDSDEETVLRKYVKNLDKVGESWTGCLERDDVLEPMERELLTIGVSFKTVSSKHHREDSSKANPGRLFFSLEKGAVPIRLDVPFRVISKVHKGCLFGEDRHKTQEKRATSLTFRRTKVKLQGTKKKGCVATMHLKIIETFPAFKVEAKEGASQHQIKRLKTAQLAKLSEALSSGQALNSQKMIFLTMSRKSCHTEHDFSEIINFGQTVDVSVSQRIRDLVREGITSVPEVKKCLRYYVHDVLFAGKQPPDVSCRAFYPTNDDIVNHIQVALRQERCSDLDQENAAKLIEDLKKQNPDARFFLRPYKEGDDAPCDENEDIQELMTRQCGSTFLFCYQSKFMADILQKYGRSAVCLDATNKTTDYALPLFLLVVKTSLCYMTVGAFMVQFETSSCIAEALEMFRTWNKELNPEYFMIDCWQAEIAAIKSVFPQSKIMLCDFHREQAWERWMRRKENGVADRERALSLLRRLAHATSYDEFEAAYKSLRESEFWE
ncbi:unnamed protein product, partial [Ixodes hexagonus]